MTRAHLVNVAVNIHSLTRIQLYPGQTIEQINFTFTHNELQLPSFTYCTKLFN